MGDERQSGLLGKRDAAKAAGSRDCIAPTMGEQPSAEDEQLAAFAKALGHPVRVQILRYLSSHDACMYGDLAGQLPLAQSTVSQHLKVLREAGLVQAELQGPKVCYSAEPAALARLKALIDELCGS